MNWYMVGKLVYNVFIFKLDKYKILEFQQKPTFDIIQIINNNKKNNRWKQCKF